MKLSRIPIIFILGMAMTSAAFTAEQKSPPVTVQPTQPCFGIGYVPYGYPGFDVCPCGSDGCFHPARYHCECGSYRKHWWRTWLRAHFRGGSMLELYPCHCVQPQCGRPYLATYPTSTDSNKSTAEPSGKEDKNAPTQDSQ